MPQLQIDLTLTVETALSVGAGGSGGVLADKAIVRDRLNRLILPGSHLKGRLRHACEVLARRGGLSVCDAPRPQTMCPHLGTIPAPCPICQIFGSPAYPGPLHFDSLIYAEATPFPTLRPGVSLNRRRRTAEDQRLYFVETSPPGGQVHFHRSPAIRGWLDAERAEAQTRLLLAGLAFLRTWGGGKSRGLGWGHVQWQARLDDEPLVFADLEAAIGALA